MRVIRSGSLALAVVFSGGCAAGTEPPELVEPDPAEYPHYDTIVMGPPAPESAQASTIVSADSTTIADLGRSDEAPLAYGIPAPVVLSPYARPDPIPGIRLGHLRVQDVWSPMLGEGPSWVDRYDDCGDGYFRVFGRGDAVVMYEATEYRFPLFNPGWGIERPIVLMPAHAIHQPSQLAVGLSGAVTLPDAYDEQACRARNARGPRREVYPD